MTRTDLGRRAAETFAALLKYHGFSDQAYADRTGYTLDKIRARRLGETPLAIDDLETFAEAFGVPFELLLQDRKAALAWVIEHDVRIDGPTTHHGRRRLVVVAHDTTSGSDFSFGRAGRPLTPRGLHDDASIWYTPRPAQRRHRAVSRVA